MVWGKTYNGHEVYIVFGDSSKDPSVDYYKGWINNSWVNLDCEIEDDNSGNLGYKYVYYYTQGNKQLVYYQEVY